MARDRNDRILIGYVEQVDLPDWGIFRLPAKVDTGALSSALHVENLREWEDGWLTFEVETSSAEKRGTDESRVQLLEARVVRRSQVRATNGKVEHRLFVSTRLCLGHLEREIEIGLVDRTDMNYRMLLGRSAIANACIVDPARCYLLS